MIEQKIPTFRLIGGKFYLASRIVNFISYTQHTCYVEPFAGSLKVLLLKPPSPVEIVNDINGDIVNFFLCIRDYPERLIRKLKYTPYSRELFSSWGKDWQPCFDFIDKDIERAARFFFLQDASFAGGFFAKGGGGWGHSNDRRLAKTFASKVDSLYSLAERLRSVQIEHGDYEHILRTYDGEDTLIYGDPPYDFPSGKEYYHVEFDHERLAQVLRSLKSKVILSYGPSELIAQLYKDWHRLEIKISYSTVHVDFDEDKPRPGALHIRPQRTEWLLFNYNPFPLLKNWETAAVL